MTRDGTQKGAHAPGLTSGGRHHKLNRGTPKHPRNKRCHPINEGPPGGEVGPGACAPVAPLGLCGELSNGGCHS